METELVALSRHRDHLVEFYDSDRSLVDSVVAFLEPALAAGDAAIIVVTEPHRDAIIAALTAAGVDLDGTACGPRLVALDAARTIAGFMLEGTPDPARFRAVINGAIECAAVGGRGVRIFGEMVAVLWAEGNIPAVMAVEDLWNELLTSCRVTLLCGYPVTAFDRPEDTAAFRRVCEKHEAVVPSESHSSLQRRLRALAPLQQEATASESERAELLKRQEDLEAALARLREVDRVRNEFLAMVAHDLANPTTVLSGLLAFLRTTWTELEGTEIQECLGVAISSTRQIERLTTDITTLARLGSDTFSYDLRPVDLASLAESVVNQVCGATGRRIDLSVDPGVPSALADADRQSQVLQNLLTNAVKFSSHDTGVLVTITAEADAVVVSVRDEGDGIAADDVTRLFRPYSRLASDRPVSGTGLGLYIAKVLVEGQGGVIRVDSEEGRGSTFTYTVPAAS